MLRKVPLKLQIAVVTFVALIDLQLYAYRFHGSPDLLGRYLRGLIDNRPFVRTKPIMPSDPLQDTGLLRSHAPGPPAQ
jgi:hypothetical protein